MRLATSFAPLSLGVILIFTLQGIVAEHILKSLNFKFGLAVCLVQFVLTAGFAIVERLLRQTLLTEPKRKPLTQLLRQFFVVAANMTVSLGGTSLAYEALSFPTVVLFKSCKVVPVMIGGIVINSRVYSTYHYTIALLLVAGLSLAALSDAHVSPDFHVVGVFWCCISLTADAMYCNLMEKQAKAECSACDTTIGTYSCSSLIMGTYMLVSGGWRAPAQHCLAHPRVCGYLLAFGFLSYLGTRLIVALTLHHGSFPTTVVASTRKMISMACSFLIFSKPLTSMTALGCALVCAGVAMQVLYQNKQAFCGWMRERGQTSPILIRCSTHFHRMLDEDDINSEGLEYHKISHCAGSSNSE